MMTATAAAQIPQSDALAYLPIQQLDLQDNAGVHFSIWQPNAKQVSVVGPFNGWDGCFHTMVEDEGHWSLWIANFPAGAEFKFEVMTFDDEAYLKSGEITFPSYLFGKQGFGGRLAL